MIFLERILFVYLVVFICNAQENYKILPSFLRLSQQQYQDVRDTLLNMVGSTTTTKNLNKLAKLGRLQPILDKFSCNTSGFRSPKRPTSVHKLRPGDIDVIGALGDSLACGSGAASINIFQMYTENRGVSAAIGGQGTWKEFLTLPNILKEFNPKLVGYALADSLSHHRAAQFNTAEVGAMSKDLPYMAEILVKRIKNDKRVNFKNDWKLISLMIGSNDFCSENCYLKNMNATPERHRKDLIKTIQYLKKNLPRTLLQIIITPNLNILINFKGVPTICSIAQAFECSCLMGSKFSHVRSDMVKVMEAWQKVEIEVGSDPKYDTNEFTVVYQPFTLNLIFPTKLDVNGNNVTDTTYLSHDCFHLSQKGNARVAHALWHNLLEPTGRKSKDWPEGFATFKCPTEDNPFIFTNRNSKDYKVV